MKRYSKKLVKLMESYLMLSKNRVMMLVKTLIIQPPVHPIHQMVIIYLNCFLIISQQNSAFNLEEVIWRFFDQKS